MGFLFFFIEWVKDGIVLGVDGLVLCFLFVDVDDISVYICIVISFLG